jgi:ABC-type phosphate/phosphonate transport system substrate-binding protein
LRRDVYVDELKRWRVLNDAMKALTIRKPISLTTTSMCSGTFAARIARAQRLHLLRIAVPAPAGWDNVAHAVHAGHFKTYGLDVEPALLPDAAAAVAALTAGVADVAYVDALTAVRARAHDVPLQFIAVAAGLDDGYVALAAAIEAKAYAMARFARALRESGAASYVEVGDLQSLIDRFASEQLIGEGFPAQDQISRVAVMSGTR